MNEYSATFKLLSYFVIPNLYTGYLFSFMNYKLIFKKINGKMVLVDIEFLWIGKPKPFFKSEKKK